MDLNHNLLSPKPGVLPIGPQLKQYAGLTALKAGTLESSGRRIRTLSNLVQSQVFYRLNYP